MNAGIVAFLCRDIGRHNAVPPKKIVGQLISNGVEYFHVDYATSSFTFYSAAGNYPPRMRELKIGAAEGGVRAVFTDIEALARCCRCRDCLYESDVGCAVNAAIKSGQLDERRLRSFQKLQSEAAHASRTLHERHERERQFGRRAKSIMAQR